MDEDGFAPFSSVENLARRANVPLEETKKAVDILEAPDRYNSEDQFEGRRIEKVANGWLILKGPFYRTILSREVAREQNRLRVADWRAKQKKSVTKETLQTITNITPVTCNPSEQSSTEQYSTPPTPLKEGSTSKKVKGVKPALKTYPQGLPDSEWIEQLVNDSTYAGIDVKREFGKMVNWCKVKRVTPTRRRFINWLNRAEKPMQPATAQQKFKDITD
jgi:hypothetical protein